MPVDLQTLDDNDKPAKRRLKDCSSAHKLYESFLQADVDAAWNRGIVRRWTDGEPPLDQADLEAAGQGWNSNVNSLRASADREQAVSSFNNLLSSVPHLCSFTTTHGKEEDRGPWEGIISEEYDWLFKEHWRSFYSYHKKTADAFITDGLGVVYWPDDRDWRFKVGRLGQFLFPPDADVDEEEQDVVLFVEDYSFSQLIKLLDSDKKVRESESGDKSFINREAIIEAIRDAAKGDSNLSTNSAEELLRRVEENTFLYDYAKSQKIKLVHYYVKEASGRVTHSIGRADGKNKEYLSDRYEAYASMQDVFVFFADGIGSWKLSSIKGQIYKALPLYMRSDILLNKADDHLMLALMKWLRSKNSAGKELLSQLTLGSLSILPPDVDFVEVQNSADIGSQVFPLLSQYDRLTANNTGGYQNHAISPEGGNRTAREVSLQAASTASLSTAKLGDYYEALDKMHGNSYARLADDNWISSDCGYEGRMEFVSRCLKRGVPMEAIRKAKPKAIRAIGYGSAQQQESAFNVLRGLIQYMSPEEQLNLAKDIAAALPGVGYDKIARYLGNSVQKTPDGTRDALNEHDTFRQGVPRIVFPDDPHFVHIPIHFTLINGNLQALEQGAIELPTALSQIGVTMGHVDEHLKLAVNDPTKVEQLKQFHKQFGQFDAVFKKLQEQAQKQQMQPNQQQGQTQDPKLMLETQKAQAEIQREDALAQAEITRKNAETAGDIQNRAARTTAHIQDKAISAADRSATNFAAQPTVIDIP